VETASLLVSIAGRGVDTDQWRPHAGQRRKAPVAIVNHMEGLFERRYNYKPHRRWKKSLHALEE
jgi:hypothetical protein